MLWAVVLDDTALLVNEEFCLPAIAIPCKPVDRVVSSVGEVCDEALAKFQGMGFMYLPDLVAAALYLPLSDRRMASGYCAAFGWIHRFRMML